MAQNVRFVKTTKERYLNRDTYDSTALYFCEDTGEIFKGDILFTEGVKIVDTRDNLPNFECAADGVVYYIADTKAGFMLAPTRDAWLQTIYAPVADVSSIPEGEEYNVVTTVGAVRDIESAIYSYVNQEIANVEGGDGVESITFAGAQMTEVDGVYSIGKDAALSALGIDVPAGTTSETVLIATTETVAAMSDELKAYVDEQMKQVETGDMDGGVIT